MQIQLFALCQSVTVNRDNSVDAIGIRDTFRADSAPALHPACSVIVKIRFDEGDEGHHKTEVRIVDLDGKPIVTTTAELDANPPEGKHHMVFQIFDLENLLFPRFGEYSLDLLIDGEIFYQNSLRLVQTKPR
jgi:hypothetical protein